MSFLDKPGLIYLWGKVRTALAGKQNKLTGTAGQVVGFDTSGNPVAQNLDTAIANPYIWNGPKTLGSLSVGSLVKLNEDGDSRKFIVLGLDHYGPNTGVTLIRSETFGGGVYNASSNAYNYYFGSILDSFCDAIWPLKLDKEIRECLVSVPIVVAEGQSVTTLHTIYRRGFALSCTEVGLSGGQTEGTQFDYFNSDQRRTAKLDEATRNRPWGLRSPSTGENSAFYVSINGTRDSSSIIYGYFSPRPAFNLTSSMVVSDVPDSDGCYVPRKKGS